MGCGCIFALLAAFSPRLAFLVIWLATDLVDQAFGGFILPLLGLMFLPFTTLFYVLVYDPAGLSLWGWLLVLLGFLFDLSAYGGSSYGRRDQAPGYRS